MTVERALEWLLDLERIRLGRDAPLRLTWDVPVEAWVLSALGLAAAACVALVYRRERGSVLRRTLLGGLRLGLVALVGALLCRPMLKLQRNRVEPSEVILLVDESRSMSRVDRRCEAESNDRTAETKTGSPTASAGELALSRLDLARASLLKDDAAVLRGSLPPGNRLRLYAFASGLREASPPGSPESPTEVAAGLSALTPEGGNSDVVGALQAVLAADPDRRIAGIVLISDGRATTPVDVFELLQSAQARQAPVYPLRVGSPDPVADVGLDAIRAPQTVFANDVLAADISLRWSGLVGSETARVRLLDDATDAVLAETSVALSADAAGSGAQQVELSTRLRDRGVRRFRVEVTGPAAEQELSNNAERFDVTVLDEQLNVLYVDTYPRYEYRYLKTALVRERSVKVSVLLLEADEGFVQEGTLPIQRFPETPEELNPYDVVLFGDVDARGNWLSLAQMRMLLDFVGNQGGGFGLIAGERYTPGRFLGTPLERLVPVRIDAEASGGSGGTITTGYRGRLTPEGRASRLFRFVPDIEENVKLIGELPSWYWYARSLGPKPGATVLLEHPTATAGSTAMPLVVSGRYGAGKLFFQATDDTWLWRRHTGEFLHDAYWIQVARSLMPDRRLGQDRRMTVTTDRRRYHLGERVGVEVRVLDPELSSALGDALTVRGVDGEGRAAMRFELRRVEERSNVFLGSRIADRPGSMLLEVEATGFVPERAITTTFQVQALDLESRRAEADHELLEQLAAGTGGSMIELDDVAGGLSKIRDRSVQIPDDVVEPLWDSRLAALLFVLLITAEWVTRKRFGLV